MNKITIYLLSVLLITACTTTDKETHPHPQDWATIIKADANFYQVDDKLYRSEQIIKDDKEQIIKADIKTIINLRYFDRNDDKKVFDNTMNLINQPLLTWRVRPADIARVLYSIESEQQHGAVLVHCYHGADRTGIVIAMYRIIYQNWSIEEARKEMQQGNFGYHSIWKNLDNLLSPIGVAQVKTELERLKSPSKLTPAQ